VIPGEKVDAVPGSYYCTSLNVSWKPVCFQKVLGAGIVKESFSSNKIAFGASVGRSGLF
jgi:hypothetical protein